MIIAGADEAGRGCVMGPLVICIATVEESRQEELKKLGVKDSKLLSPAGRERLDKRIVEVCGTHLIFITAKELNSLMKKHSLNEIEAMKIGEELNKIEFAKLFVDSPDTVAKRFEERIRKYCKRDDIVIVSDHKADYKYPIVSAASIVAKVARDAEIEKIKKELGYDFNSGYSSDPMTIEFLKENLHRKDVQEYIRSEWETISNLKQRKLSDY